jgi:BASS family bile acid:Na+ symporter
MSESAVRNIYLAGAILLALATALLIVTGNGALPVMGVVLFVMFYAFGDVVKRTKTASGLTFTFQIFAWVAFTLYFPQIFTNWGFNTKLLIVPSVQVIMFGMGTKLSLGDFAREFRRPVKILVGSALGFILMPLAGLAILKLYHFPPEVAAGVILIGVCPTGAASNVMTYLARGNLALALSITMLATLVAPVTTPLMMKLFAGQLIAVNTISMMMGILNMVIVPVAAGLICNKILYSKGKSGWLQQHGNLIGLGVVCFVCGVGLIFTPFGPNVKSLQSGLILVLWAVTTVSITKVLVARAHGPEDWMEMVLPKLSLVSIMLYIVIVAAQSRATLLSIGPALFVATVAHNLLGLFLGYASARALRLSDADTRCFTLQVGLKNAGVGVGLAYDVLKSEGAALASLIFGTWMNVSGSTLANFWRLRPPVEPGQLKAVAPATERLRA